MMPQSGELRTWKQIAAHLGVSVRTAQNYEREGGLPVRRLGDAGQIVAFITELDVWMEARLKSRAKHSESLELSSSQTIETLVSIIGVLPGESQTPRRGRLRHVIRQHWRQVFLAVAAIAAVVYFWWPSHIPVDYRTEVATLSAVDAAGREVWHHSFQQPFLAHAYEEYGHTSHATFADFGRQNRTLLFLYFTDDRSISCPVICFSRTGHELWRFQPGRQDISDAGGDHYYPPYWPATVQVVPGLSPGAERVVVTSTHSLGAPDQVAILDNTGRLVGEYWHPGHLLRMAHADLDRDGKEEIILAGVNNGEHAATLVVLDPDHANGTPHGLSSKQLEFTGLPKSTEKAVVLFPRTDVAKSKPYNRVIALQLTANRVVAVTAEDISDTSQVNIIYQLDHDLKVVSAEPTLQFQNEHRVMEKRGELDHGLTQSEIDELKTLVIVKRAGATR